MLQDEVHCSRLYNQLERHPTWHCNELYHSEILFVLAMEVIIRTAKCKEVGEWIAPGQELPPISAFLDDITTLNLSINYAEAILNNLSELMNWACMKFQAKKSKSIMLKKGKEDEQYQFEHGEETAQTVSEQPVKSVGTDEMKHMK